MNNQERSKCCNAETYSYELRCMECRRECEVKESGLSATPQKAECGCHKLTPTCHLNGCIKTNEVCYTCEPQPEKPSDLLAKERVDLINQFFTHPDVSSDFLNTWEKEFIEEFCEGEYLDGSRRSIPARNFIYLLLQAQAAKSYADERDEQLEIVICAAVKDSEGKIFRGHRHSDCFRTIAINNLKSSYNPEDQGFITSKNRFVNRAEGRKLQDAAGIPSADSRYYNAEELYSENLY